MDPLPHNITDTELIAFIDKWAALMESEDYQAAFIYTDHVVQMDWSPNLIRQAIKNYGDGLETQKVTVAGKPTDIRQRKKVTRWQMNASDEIGEVWYDLNINGLASDLTATFSLQTVPKGIVIRLNDIHVM